MADIIYGPTHDYPMARCDVTGNPWGTDTRLIGDPCKCASCRRTATYWDLRERLAQAEAACNAAHRESAMLLEGNFDADARIAVLVAALGLDTPWPIQSVLKRLADAADHLLRDHDCDAHGWEGVGHARDAARTIVAALESRDAAQLLRDYSVE